MALNPNVIAKLATDATAHYHQDHDTATLTASVYGTPYVVAAKRHHHDWYLSSRVIGENTEYNYGKTTEDRLRDQLVAALTSIKNTLTSVISTIDGPFKDFIESLTDQGFTMTLEAPAHRENPEIHIRLTKNGIDGLKGHMLITAFYYPKTNKHTILGGWYVLGNREHAFPINIDGFDLEKTTNYLSTCPKCGRKLHPDQMHTIGFADHGCPECASKVVYPPGFFD